MDYCGHQVDDESGQVTAALDPGRDDYYGHSRRFDTDVADSHYLDTNPISVAPKLRLGSVVATKKVAGGRLFVRARVSNPGTGRVTVQCSAKQGKRRLRVAFAQYSGGSRFVRLRRRPARDRQREDHGPLRDRRREPDFPSAPAKQFERGREVNPSPPSTRLATFRIVNAVVETADELRRGREAYASRAWLDAYTALVGSRSERSAGGRGPRAPGDFGLDGRSHGRVPGPARARPPRAHRSMATISLRRGCAAGSG